MKKIHVLFLLFCFVSSFINAQTNPIKISCKVIDARTKKPIVYATVMLKKINRGTHADFNGNFEIPIKYKKTGTIKISSIGYKTKLVKLSELKENVVNLIYLSTSNNVIDEIIVKSSLNKKKKLLAKQIVRKAIGSILKNYPTQSL